MLTRRAQRLLPSYLRPPAVVVGVVGLLASLAVLVLPPLELYAGGWYLLLMLTAVCYGLLAASQAGPGRMAPRVKDPDLDTVLRLRQEMGARLAALPPDSPVTGGLSDLLAQLDRELIPSLADLVAKRQALGGRLAEYDDTRSDRIRPHEATLGRLKNLHRRQDEAVQAVVQQVVNMDAALLGLIEEGDETRMAGQVQEWAEEINLRWQSLAEVLGVEDATGREDDGATRRARKRGRRDAGTP